MTATVTGKRELKALEIDPEAVDPDDVEMLQDMIVAAVNEPRCGLRKTMRLPPPKNPPGGLHLCF